MGWRGETYFSRSQNGRAAPYIDDMDSDSDYEYDDLSRVPEHLLSKSWDDPSILQTYAPTAGASAAPPPQRVTPSPFVRVGKGLRIWLQRAVLAIMSFLMLLFLWGSHPTSASHRLALIL